MNNHIPSSSKPKLSKSTNSLNRQIFWIILTWMIALLVLGVTVAKDQGARWSKPIVNSQKVLKDNSNQTILLTMIFLAIGTVSCSLAILMVRRLSTDLHQLNQEISQANGRHFSNFLSSDTILPVHAQEVDRLTKSSYQLIDNFQRSLIQQQAVDAQSALFRDLLALSQRSRSPQPIYTQAVKTIKKILEVDRAFVYKFGVNWSGSIEIQDVSFNFPLLVDEQVIATFFTKSMVEVERYRDGLILVVNDANTSGFSLEQLSLYQEAQIKSNIAAPIMVRDRLVGLLCVQQCSATRHWQKWEIDMCADTANFLGLVLNQAESTEKSIISDQFLDKTKVGEKTILQEKETALHLQILSRISTELPQSDNPHDFMKRLMDEMRITLQLHRAIFFQMDADFSGEIVVESVDPTIKSINGEEIVDTCLQTNRGCGYETGRISAINDIYTTDLTECHLRMMERLEIRANIVAPVIIERRLHGLLIGHMSRAAREWQQPEIDLLAQVARQIGLVMTQSALVKELQEQKDSQVMRDQRSKTAKENLQNKLVELIDRTEL
jgi:methyl-accepting chemotaxis protein PixJ